MATKKKFDAVTESRKWRVATGKNLSSMTEEERLAYLNHDVGGKLKALHQKTSKNKIRRTSNTARKHPAKA